MTFFESRYEWECVPNFVLVDLATGAHTQILATAPKVLGDCPSATMASVASNASRVAFGSSYPFVRGDQWRTEDVYVWHREGARFELVSADVHGAPAGGNLPKISDDGRFVVFTSMAKTLVEEDDNDKEDVFVRDLDTGRTELVSVSSAGKRADGHSGLADISADGSVVAFVSDATNLVPGDNNDKRDVFVRDRRLGATERVSVSALGGNVNGDSYEPALSGDGRFVAFVSEGTNLVKGVGADQRPAYVRDRKLRKTEAPGVGNRPDKRVAAPSLSGDGRYLSYVDSEAGLQAEIDGGLVRLDRTTKSIELVSLAGDIFSGNPRQLMSRDGKRHVFELLLQVVLVSELSNPAEKPP